MDMNLKEKIGFFFCQIFSGRFFVLPAAKNIFDSSDI